MNRRESLRLAEKYCLENDLIVCIRHWSGASLLSGPRGDRKRSAGVRGGIVNNEGFHRSNVALKNLSSLTIIGTSCDNSPCISGPVPFRVSISGDAWDGCLDCVLTVHPTLVSTFERVRWIYKFIKETDRSKGNFIHDYFFVAFLNWQTFFLFVLRHITYVWCFCGNFKYQDYSAS